ncbi:MAG: UDP-glucose 4-epimerase GalE [Lentisphaeria bacterium]|nr:UDP-glucose 4-epimerase GalE [Lentisphaeria bacterium]
MGKILLTGGMGFIGSHTAVELLEGGYDVLIVDDLSNSEASVLDRVETITGKRPGFVQADVADAGKMEKIFSENAIDAVIHFAGFKAVGESVAKPLEYYRNNLDSTLTLLETMKKHDCRTIIFSSSATVYGDNSPAPFAEDAPTGNCTNPYGWTKYMIEQILKGLSLAAPKMFIGILRYFNPIGAHPSGLIGEKPNGIPNNLLPYVTQTAAGIREKLSIFGNDYPTKDGTGVRDFIHVVDLAKGHVATLKYAEKGACGVEIFNLGTGVGYSVLDIVNTFERVNGVKVPHVFAPRRPGDIAECYSNPTRANTILGWKTAKTLDDMCRDAWNWQQKGSRA